MASRTGIMNIKHYGTFSSTDIKRDLFYKNLLNIISVSYTHLDVYKRQDEGEHHTEMSHEENKTCVKLCIYI